MAIVTVEDVAAELGVCEIGMEGAEYTAITSAMVRAEAAIKRFLRYDPAQATRTEFYPQHDTTSHPKAAVWEVQGSYATLRYVASAGADKLQVQHLPIRSITSLYADYDGRSGARSGSFGAESLKTSGDDYWANWDAVDSSGSSYSKDGLIFSVMSWPTTPGTVKIVYVAGYTDTEFRGTDGTVDATPIFEAVVNEAARRAKKTLMLQKKSTVGFVPGTIQSERLGDYSYTLGSTAKSDEQTYGNLWDLMSTTREQLYDYVNYGWSLAG